jgi:hypothetical protein
MRERLLPLQKLVINLLLLSAVAFCYCLESKAQTTPVNPQPSGQESGAKAGAGNTETAQTGKLVVTEVTGNLALYNSITVTVDNLSGLLPKDSNDFSKVILHLDSYPLNGLAIRRVSADGPDKDKLIYDLNRADDTNTQMTSDDIEKQQRSWMALLGRPNIFPSPKKKYVRVSVGPENNPIETKVTSYPMTVVNATAYWVYVIAFFGVAFALYHLAVKSDLLRDPGPDPKERDEHGVVIVKRKPFSLARTQMALWFFFILAAFIFIWLVSASLTSLSGTVLGLMGISAGTALGSAVIDSNKRGAIDNKKEELDKRRKALLAEIAAIQAKVAASPSAEELKNLQADLASKKSVLDQTESELANLNEGTKPMASDGFILDILSDDNGVSFHRFQIFAWTLALIVIFVVSVYKVLSMPDFDGTLLALMGISSGTYLGFKIPEPRTPPEDNPPAATPGSPAPPPDPKP